MQTYCVHICKQLTVPNSLFYGVKTTEGSVASEFSKSPSSPSMMCMMSNTQTVFCGSVHCTHLAVIDTDKITLWGVTWLQVPELQYGSLCWMKYDVRRATER